MRDALFRTILIGGLFAAAAASAAEDPKAGNTVSELVVIANRPPTVEELTVIPRADCLPPKPRIGSDRPKIVSTYPRPYEAVRPGLLILRVTFDQPMSCSGFVAAAPGQKSPCGIAEQHFLLTFDRKTVRVVCVVKPATRYVLYLGAGPRVEAPDGSSSYLPQFVSLDDQTLKVSHMTFTVSSAAPIQTIPDALSADPETVLADVYRPARRAKAGGGR